MNLDVRELITHNILSMTLIDVNQLCFRIVSDENELSVRNKKIFYEK